MLDARQTREYKVETMSNITRVKKSESILSGRVLVTCSVTISGLWSHSGTGEERADDDNSVTSADARAFKASLFVLWPGPLLLRCSSNLGRSGPEPAGEDTCICPLGL